MERLGPIETLPSPVPQAGGGTRQRIRPAPIVPPAIAQTRADPVQVPGRDSSQGQVEASPWAEQGERRALAGVGVPGLQPREMIGTLAESEPADGSQAVRSLAVSGPARVDSIEQPSVSLGEQSENGTFERSGSITRRPAGAIGPVPVPVPVAGTLAADSAELLPREVAIAPQIGPVAENAAGALEVAVDAPRDFGGLDRDRTPDVGTVNRRTQPDSQYVVDRGARFLRRDLGGPPSVDARVAIPSDAFLSRFSRKGEEIVGGDGRPSPKTEEAIELGLLYLARQQEADGRWSLRPTAADSATDPDPPVSIQSDTAATGLVLLSFLGAGYHHYDDKYRDAVRLGLQFLIDQQQPNGDLYLPQDQYSSQSAWFYSHGIATIALCEAYGMTQDPQLREPAQKGDRLHRCCAASHAGRMAVYAPGRLRYFRVGLDGDGPAKC